MMMIATYKVNARNGRQVKMEGDPDDLDKILHQMKTWQQMHEALTKELGFLTSANIPDWGRIDMIQAALNAAKE